MNVRRNVEASNFSVTLENLNYDATTPDDATTPEQVTQETIPVTLHVDGDHVSQMSTSGNGSRGHAQMFNEEDLERLFGTNDRVNISQLDLNNHNGPAEPTREEVVAANYPEFAEHEGINEVPTEEMQQEINNEQVIPANSNSLLISEETSRFSSAIWYDKIREQRIILAGAGGIGSYVGFLLSRMHPENITIYDDDDVEAGNLSGQLYADNHIGRAKVSALGDIMSRFSWYYGYSGINRRFTAGSHADNIMICGFDNMDSRRVFYRSWKAHVMSLPEEERKNCLYIDGRLAAEEFQVLCIQGNNVLHMEKFERDWLFSDEEAEATQCSYKQTSFCANMIASVMVNLFVNFIANKCEPLVDRAIPFFTYYDASQMFFKEEF